jgi:hypothetical protein
MSVNTVRGPSSVGDVRQYQELTPEQLQRRLQLFQGDSMDTNKAGPAGVGSQDSGLSGSDPSSAAGTEQFMQMMRNASPEQQAQVLEAGNQIFKGISTDSPNSPALQQTLASGLATVGGALGAKDDQSVLNGTVKATIASAENDVKEFATTLQGNLDEKAALRDQMTEVRAVISEIDEIIDEGVYPQTIQAFDENGNPVEVTINNEQEATDLKEKMEGLNEDLDSKYQTAADMTQMMQLELQDAISKQNEAFQLLSNILKANADLIKGILNNLKA